MIAIAPLLGLVLLTQTTTLSRVGTWEGSYRLGSTTYKTIVLELDEQQKIDGTYDFRKAHSNNWEFGKIHGDYGKNGRLTFLFRFGSNRDSWGEIIGTFSLSDDGRTLASKDAEYFQPHTQEEKRQSATVELKRHTGE